MKKKRSVGIQTQPASPRFVQRGQAVLNAVSAGPLALHASFILILVLVILLASVPNQLETWLKARLNAVQARCCCK